MTKRVGEMPAMKHIATKQTVQIKNIENRKFDLHVGRDVEVFAPGEARPIPREWLDHPDFIQARNHFAIKGV